MIDDKILLELVLKLGSFETKSQRNTVGALDLMGDVGGFLQFIDLSIFMLAEFFAAKFFIQSIAGDLYKRKKTRREMEVEQNVADK